MLTDDAIRALARDIWSEHEEIEGHAFDEAAKYQNSDDGDFEAVRLLSVIIRRHLSQNEPNRNTSPQPVAGGDMSRAVELLRRAAYVNRTSIPRFVKFDGHHWGDDARDFLASIGGEA